MGKKRIHQLLTHMKENQQAELRNAAAIYTVAQVAVNELAAIAPALDTAETKRRAIAPISSTPALPPAVPTALTQEDLLQRYGSYNGCRSAAKKLGIHFPKTPSWPQLITAFSYVDLFRHLIQDYAQQQRIPHLSGVQFTITLT